MSEGFFMSYNETDIKFMQRAIALARKGGGFVHPNPLVGCVVVKDDQIISDGYHEYYGGFHAERNALKDCDTEIYGSTLYVTLEPCCHHGKTPPCTDIIIEKGIKNVFVGILDPNPLVAGKGIKILQEHGINVTCGLCEDEIKEMNKVFLNYIAHKTPYVLMKAAMTLDGKIASHTGDSKWISNENSRKLTHKLRNDFMAVAVGIGTVIADNPLLNCRLEGNICQSIRIVIDTRAGIPLDSMIVKTAGEYRTIVAHGISADKEKLNILNSLGVETVECLETENHVDIKDMLSKLGQMGIDSILLEGGGTVNEAFIKAGCVDEVMFFIAPKIIGGANAKTPVEGLGIDNMSDAVQLTDVTMEMIDNDILVKGKIKK